MRYVVHGHTVGGKVTAEYAAWSHMRARCTRRSHPEYPRYGGRGISICARWGEFKNFLADMGRRPSPSLSIDRIDNDGNYEPGNCRWATAREQWENSRHSPPPRLLGENHPHSKLTADEVKAIRGLLGVVYQRDIAKRFGVSQSTIMGIATGRTWAWLP